MEQKQTVTKPVVSDKPKPSVRSPIHILSVGNSYSSDQQTYVHQMAQAAGVDIVVGNAYISSCTFRKHMSQWETGGSDYTYYENGQVVATGVSLREIIIRHGWDYVTFQPGTEAKNYIIPNNPYLGELVGIIRSFHPWIGVVFNIHWPDADDSSRAIFAAAFDKSRAKNWDYIVEMAHEAYNDCDISYQIPVGVAFMEAYEEYGGLMHRDRFHSSELGRYLHACVWFEFFTGLPAPENYAPSSPSYATGVLPTDEQRAHLRAHAHSGLKKYTEAGGRMPALFARTDS